jgi:quercetin dioxygenase-like cupin family protein
MSTERPANTTSLESTYVHLRDDRSAATVDVTESFWPELTSGGRPDLEAGRLVMTFEFASSWPTWERHPAGEELVILIGGRATLVLELDGTEHARMLERPGEFVLVPRGVWHTARTDAPCTMLFVTPGEGTENRPVASD